MSSAVHGLRFGPTPVLPALYCPCCTALQAQDSIKASQQWFMACAAHAGGMARMMARRAVALRDFDKQLHLVYLANDILFKRLGG